MSITAKKFKDYPAIVKALVTHEKISVTLSDGREISLPLTRSPRLFKATPQQRANLKISPSGYGISWPDIDEDLSIKAFLD